MTVLGLVLVGLVAGTLAALLGVGGGIVYVPALVAIFELTQKTAQGTSLAVIVPTTLVATITHAAAGRVDWRAWWRLGLGAVAGGVLGALVARQLDDAVLRRLFAVLLVLTAVRMALRIERRR